MARLKGISTERTTVTASFPEYDGAKSYDAYIEQCINSMDQIIESRTNEPAIGNDVPWYVDTDNDVDKDNLTELNPNNKNMVNHLTAQNPEAKCSSYFEYIQKKTNDECERAMDAFRSRTGQNLQTFTQTFGGLDKMNMSMDQVLNAIASANAKDMYNRNRPANVNTENGRYVRPFTPNFSIVPGGNPYARDFAYWSRMPMTPQYEQVKALYAAEEMKAVERSKSFYRLCKPEGYTDEEWEIETDIRTNPYTKYGPEIPKTQSVNQEPIDYQLERRCKFSFTVKTKYPDGNVTTRDINVDELCNDQCSIMQSMAFHRKVEEMRRMNSVTPQMLYKKMILQKQEALDKVCPGWDTKSVQEFFGDNNFSTNYMYKSYLEPKQRYEAYMRKYEDRYGMPKVLPMETYLRNIGMQRLNDVAAGQTEGDLMIQKLNLIPGTPGYDIAAQRKADEVRWCQENINPDGSYNIDKLKEKYPNWDAMKKAHKLSIMYTNHKATIADTNSMLDLPLHVEAGLTTEEKQACGLLPEAPDYNAMKAYADERGQTILEAFDLRHSPFKNRFNADGTLKEGGFGQPGFEPKNTCKYKTIKDCPDFFLKKEDIPEQFINDFAWSPQDKRWLNLDRI